MTVFDICAFRRCRWTAPRRFPVSGGDQGGRLDLWRLVTAC